MVYSDCDPFGTAPNGLQVFAMSFDGRLGRLTHTAGVRATDGALDIEFPGPAARGGLRLR